MDNRASERVDIDARRCTDDGFLGVRMIAFPRFIGCASKVLRVAIEITPAAGRQTNEL